MEKKEINRKALIFGLIFGLFFYLLFGVYTIYTIFASDSSTAIFGILNFLYPGAIVALMFFTSGWNGSYIYYRIKNREEFPLKEISFILHVILFIFLILVFLLVLFFIRGKEGFQDSLSFSPNGSEMVFTYGLRHNSDIYIADISSLKVRKVKILEEKGENYDPVNVQFDATGENLIFIANENIDDKEFESRHGIIRGNVKKVNIASGVSESVKSPNVSEIALMPDGENLYYIDDANRIKDSLGRNLRAYRLGVINLVDNSYKFIKQFDGIGATGLKIASQSGQIIYQQYNPTSLSLSSLVSIKPDRETIPDKIVQLSKLKTPSYIGNNMAISPDGSYVVYDYESDIYRMDLTNLEVKRLTYFKEEITQDENRPRQKNFIITPDGRYLYLYFYFINEYPYQKLMRLDLTQQSLDCNIAQAPEDYLNCIKSANGRLEQVPIDTSKL